MLPDFPGCRPALIGVSSIWMTALCSTERHCASWIGFTSAIARLAHWLSDPRLTVGQMPEELVDEQPGDERDIDTAVMSNSTLPLQPCHLLFQLAQITRTPATVKLLQRRARRAIRESRPSQISNFKGRVDSGRGQNRTLSDFPPAQCSIDGRP